MYRRVLITVMAGATLVSLCSVAQDTKSNQTPSTGDSQPAATADSQTPSAGNGQPAATANSQTPSAANSQSTTGASSQTAGPNKTPKPKQSSSRLRPWKK